MRNELIQSILRSFKRLDEVDGCLFEMRLTSDVEDQARKLHEVCINHRLALYFETFVLPHISTNEPMFIDLEFNKRGNNSKDIEIDGDVFTVRPDIIIHNRKDDLQKYNLLIVECKKLPCSTQLKKRDGRKIEAFLKNEKYQYKFGLQVFYSPEGTWGYFFEMIGSNMSFEKIQYS